MEIFSHPFTLRECVSLILRCVSCMQHNARFCLHIQSASLCLFIGELSPLMFRYIRDWAEEAHQRGHVLSALHSSGPWEGLRLGPPAALTGLSPSREVSSQRAGLHPWADWAGEAPSGRMPPSPELGTDSRPAARVQWLR